jgi:hypothetical protein
VAPGGQGAPGHLSFLPSDQRLSCGVALARGSTSTTVSAAALMIRAATSCSVSAELRRPGGVKVQALYNTAGLPSEPPPSSVLSIFNPQKGEPQSTQKLHIWPAPWAA